MGADVIIGGRSSDAAIFAAAAIYEGFPENHAYYPREGPRVRLLLR